MRENYLQKEFYELLHKDANICEFILDDFFDGLWYRDLENSEEEWINEKFWTTLGYNPHEMPHKAKVGKDIIFEEDLALVNDNFNKHIENQNHPYDHVVRYWHKTGNPVKIRSRGKAVRNDEGKAVGMLVVHQKITDPTDSDNMKNVEIKLQEYADEMAALNEEYLSANEELRQINEALQKAKEEILERENRFRKMADNMPAGIAMYKPIDDGAEFRFIEINKEAENITNSSRNELIGNNLLDKFPNMDKSPLYEGLRQVAKNGGEVYIPPFYYKDKEREGWRENNIYKLETGEIVAVFKDVTPLKKAEELLKKRNDELRKINDVLKKMITKLEKSEFNLKRAQEKAHLGSWYLDVASNEVEWTEELYKMYGFDPKLPPPPYNEHRKLFTPESWDILSASLENTRLTGKPYELELETIKNDGRNGWMWVRGEVVKNDENKTIGLWGAAQDISKQKYIEEELISAKRKAEEGEEYIHEIIDNLFEGYQILDFNWRYQYVNKAAEVHNQRPKEELLGNIYMDCWPDITETKIFRLLKDCMENRKFHRFENEFIFPSGGVGWFDIGIQPVKDGVFILSNDITDRKLAQQKLLREKERTEENEKQLKKAQSTAKIGNWIWYIQDKRLWWSDEMYNIFEIAKENFTGDLDEIINTKIHPEDRDKVREANRSVVMYNKSVAQEYRIKSQSGDYKYVLGQADEIILEEDGNRKIITGIVKDITDYKHIQSQLERAKEKAEESNRLKSAFLANMSHEIRTPMNAITGFASFLKNRNRSRDEIDQYADIIMNGGKHLLNLINDIIDISKIDAGQITVTKSVVNLQTLMKDIFNLFHSDLMSKNNFSIHLKVGIPGEQILIVTDETRLRQILINLIGNAIKFTEKGEIEFGYSIKEHKIEFFVRDTGIGISKEKREVIFERFQQGTDNTEKLYGGTGLGLSIAKACTQLLNGKIWLKSKLNKGTTFFFTIEYDPIETPADLNKDKEEDIVYTFDRELILVAEDDEYNYEYLKVVLNEHNLDVVRAKTGRQAIEKTLGNNNIKLILMDIQMPDLTGIEATLEIRKHKPSMPIIAQTAYALDSDKERFLAAGCNEYISKPVNDDHLLSLVNRLLRQKV